MAHVGRTLFPFLVLALLVTAVVWSVSFGTLAPADFTFVNGTEVQSIDPARVTGTPEGRILTSIFEGLYRPDPKTLKPLPGVAKSHDLSSDSKVYTFHLRRDARWSDGSRVTAGDFAFSWQRMLHPETASQYAMLLGECVVGADKYHNSLVAEGDKVEVELPGRSMPEEPFPRGKMSYGKLLKIEKTAEPKIPDGTSDDAKEKITYDWRATWIYTVDIDGQSRRFCKEPMPEMTGVEKCLQLLLDFSEVGIKAPDDETFVITLMSPTPYFPYLAEFFPLFPVQRACVERFGYPAWTKTENIVVNGPFTMEFRRLRDRIRLRKNPQYWDAANVNLDVADALAVESPATGLNMYLDNQVDWTEAPPSSVIPKLRDRNDYMAEPSLAVAFYRINVTVKPLDNKKLRQALNAAVDKKVLCEKLLRAGQIPARSIVPPGLPGYTPALCGEFDEKEAQRLLAEAGYPGGQGLGPVEILYNSSGEQEKMAQYIGGNWEKYLGLRCTYKSLEWGSYLTAQQQLNYEISRSGWTGDYPDPNTFLGLFVSYGEQNQTGWKNKEFDKLIQASARETDPKKRMEIFHKAEAIIMDEVPIIPMYYYVQVNLVKPYVHGFYPNTQDLHPLRAISIDKAARAQYLQAGEWAVTAFLVRRLIWLAITLWAVYTVSFVLMHSVRGGPFSQERKLEPDVLRNIEKRYHLDQPLYKQYLENMWLALQGDLGPSFKLRDFTVNSIIAQGFPVSASLGILALSFALALGITAGVLASLWRQQWPDYTVMSVATIGIAVPNFWLASVCIVLFVFLIPLFPAAGWGSPSQLVLPVFCLGAPFAAYIARLTRAGMLEVLSQDFIRTARAKGLSPSRVVIHHALKGAMIPVVSFLGPAVAEILTGSLVVEKIFFLPGMGSHFVDAAIQRDYTVAMGVTLVYTLLLYVMNTLVDLSYRMLDPRIELS